MSGELAEHLELCAALAAGNLDPADRTRLAEHLAEGCDECERALPEYQRATVLLAASLPLSAPALTVRARVLEAVAGAVHEAAASAGSVPAAGAGSVPAASASRTPAAVAKRVPAAGAGSVPAALASRLPAAVVGFPASAVRGVGKQGSGPPTPSASWVWAASCGASVIAALAAGALAWHYAGEARQLHAAVASSNDVITAINQQLQDEKSWSVLFTSPEARTATLLSTSRSEVVLRARAAYDPRTQHAVFVFNGLTVPRGKVYQLWSLEGPKFSSLGLIKPDGFGQAVVRVERAGDVNRLSEFGVSLENSGGSPSAAGPKGPIVMSGRVEG